MREEITFYIVGPTVYNYIGAFGRYVKGFFQLIGQQEPFFFLSCGGSEIYLSSFSEMVDSRTR
jgi:hypothetical protein